VVLVHGAANSAGVWRGWQGGLEALGWRTLAVDLRGHGAALSADLSRVRMQDYVDDVAAAPAAREDPSIPLREGEFGPEEYGVTSRDPRIDRGVEGASHWGLVPSRPTLQQAVPVVSDWLTTSWRLPPLHPKRRPRKRPRTHPDAVVHP
jgi:hypothetical protein